MSSQLAVFAGNGTLTKISEAFGGKKKEVVPEGFLIWGKFVQQLLSIFAFQEIKLGW